jgi:uncharacterized membrane protein YfcA
VSDLILLGIAAFLAGFVDSVVGGGGLIQLPALFSVFPSASPASLLGTSKFAGVWGTSVAAFKYMRVVKIRWAILLPAGFIAFLFAFFGAMSVTHLSPVYLRKLLPFLLLGVALYTFWKKDLGAHASIRYSERTEFFLLLLVASTIGFYDGFFGPGTGSFFMFILVRLLGYDFLQASASAKVLNVFCNAAALLWFGFGGHVMWLLGGAMAICGVVGSILGTSLAVRHGSRFVRGLFLFVVSSLILKTGFDAFMR